jgi:nitrate reductase gamma subunit
MDFWIGFARGPLFRACLTVALLGLAYRAITVTIQVVSAWRRAGDRRLPIRDILSASLGWLFPVRLFSCRPVYGSFSVLFHIGMLTLPLFLLGHVTLLGSLVPSWWPTFSPTMADTITVVSVVALAVLLGGRIIAAPARKLSRPGDFFIPGLLLLVFALGFLASHPALTPFSARTMVLLHVMSANLVLLITPFSKIAHCVLYPFLQLVFQLGWHFPAESGRHVAQALAKENEPV